MDFDLDQLVKETENDWETLDRLLQTGKEQKAATAAAAGCPPESSTSGWGERTGTQARGQFPRVQACAA